MIAVPGWRVPGRATQAPGVPALRGAPGCPGRAPRRTREGSRPQHGGRRVVPELPGCEPRRDEAAQEKRPPRRCAQASACALAAMAC